MFGRFLITFMEFFIFIVILTVVFSKRRKNGGNNFRNNSRNTGNPYGGGYTPGNTQGYVQRSQYGNPAGGMQRSRTGNPAESMQGSRTGNPTGGMQGSRTGNPTEGMQGNRTGNPTGSMQGNRTGSALRRAKGNPTGNTALNKASGGTAEGFGPVQKGKGNKDLDSTTEYLERKAMEDAKEHAMEKLEEQRRVNAKYGNVPIARRHILGDPVPSGMKLVCCGYCGAENEVKIGYRGSLGCYFCRTEL